MSATNPLPAWLNKDLFVSVLKKNVNNFEKILNFTAKPALSAGENYLSTLWSIAIDVKLKGNNKQNLQYTNVKRKRKNKKMIDFLAF